MTHFKQICENGNLNDLKKYIIEKCDFNEKIYDSDDESDEDKIQEYTKLNHIQWAIKYKNVNIVQHLLFLGITYENKDFLKTKDLNFILQFLDVNNITIFDCILCDYYEIITHIPNFKEKINEKLENNNTLLHLACLQNNFNAVQFLIQNGIDINALNNYGENALYIIITNFNVVDPNILSVTPTRQIIKFLFESGADYNNKNMFIKLIEKYRHYYNISIADVYEFFFDKGFSVNNFVYDENPLIIAILYENFELANRLLNYDANINIYNSSQQSLFHLLARKLIYENTKNLLLLLIEKIHQKGLDINSKDKYGNTPIFYVNVSCVLKKFIDLGADIKIQNNKNMTAFDYILVENKSMCKQELLQMLKIKNNVENVKKVELFTNCSSENLKNLLEKNGYVVNF